MANVLLQTWRHYQSSLVGISFSTTPTVPPALAKGVPVLMTTNVMASVPIDSTGHVIRITPRSRISVQFAGVLGHTRIANPDTSCPQLVIEDDNWVMVSLSPSHSQQDARLVAYACNTATTLPRPALPLHQTFSVSD